jgi:hypothetical protein
MKVVIYTGGLGTRTSHFFFNLADIKAPDPIQILIIIFIYLIGGMPNSLGLLCQFELADKYII